MRTLIIGKPSKQHIAMDEAAREALAAVEAQMVPGRTAGDVFDAHARVMDAHGMKNHRLNACGYSLGAKFTPSWMDSPMFYKDNPVAIQPGMVFFAHMILMNSEAGAAYCLGRTYIIGKKGPEPVSKAPLEMITR
jgi:Xaa-Pro dipeptidase